MARSSTFTKTPISGFPSARRLFECGFPEGDLFVEAHGNVLSATAFLQGLSTRDLRPEELDFHDPDYEVLITVRAVKHA